ncbi:tRNA (adenosine(37)-N6)-dimethylallyltransferase MiaA [Fodinisporobacter ferrooxydans]|uniref:tRNA dimethylallyltransferase n=1 Tax=Fodinisporobacter ferrooxydans TaxID=2901836 RepID=A0ABY4CFZ0_9BACL|nr:tRNA (adenosine(37)-N6)-dimethylallyltransferase MiaA [Alicyclobacillaceae bacterium MYW30-H2]
MDISTYNTCPDPAMQLPHAKQSRPLICIVGPTAVGKTKFGVELAKRIGGEIISADSMQIYRGMDIGTAKATQEERQGIPHHCIDIVDADKPFTVSDYREWALESMESIYQRQKIPIVVGGTGLYVQSLTHTMTFTQAKEDRTYRDKLFQQGETETGKYSLYQKLQEIDPKAANRLHPNDLRRVIRALEVYHVTGAPMSEQYGEYGENKQFRTLMFGLNRNRENLYAHIDERVDHMIEKGLLEEVEDLLKNHVTPDCTSMQAIGYKEIVAYISGECTFDEAVAMIKQGSRRYAKRQLSWFRRFPEIKWFHVDEEDSAIILQKMVSEIEGIL